MIKFQFTSSKLIAHAIVGAFIEADFSVQNNGVGSIILLISVMSFIFIT